MNPLVWLGLGVGIGVGVGAALLSPNALQQVSRNIRPQAKSLSKGAVRAYMQAREGAAHFGEYVEDLVAEAQAEVVEERRTAAEATGAPADDGEPAAETEAAAAASKAKTGNGGAPESPNWPPGPGIGGDGDR